MSTLDLRFEHPHELHLETAVVACKWRRDRLRVATRHTIAEPANAEGGDHGMLEWDGGRLRFDRVFATPNGLVWHEGEPVGEPPQVQSPCALHVDADRRHHHEAYHSVSHLLTAVHCELAGGTVLGRSAVFDDHGELSLTSTGEAATVDLAAHAPEAWARALTYVGSDELVQEIMLDAGDARAIIPPAYGAVLPSGLELVRLVRVGHDLRWIPCRGVHVSSLAEIAAVRSAPVAAPADDLAEAYVVSVRDVASELGSG